MGTLRGVTGALRGELLPVLRRAGGLAAEAGEAGKQGTAAAEQALLEIRQGGRCPGWSGGLAATALPPF